MRRLRLLVLLATLLTLPVYGLAGVAQLGCDAQVSSGLHDAVPSDCCSGKVDQNTSCNPDGEGPMGKSCKSGCSCTTPQSYEPTSSWVLPTVVTRHIRSANPPIPLFSHSPYGLWRPPRLS
jgi:hypothetical protein